MTIDLTNHEVKEAIELAEVVMDIMEPEDYEWLLIGQDDLKMFEEDVQ